MDEIIQWKDKTELQRETIIEQITGEDSTHRCPECDSQAHCDIAAGKKRVGVLVLSLVTCLSRSPISFVYAASV